MVVNHTCNTWKLNSIEFKLKSWRVEDFNWTRIFQLNSTFKLDTTVVNKAQNELLDNGESKQHPNYAAYLYKRFIFISYNK
jgi:hypothetical protein